MNRLAGNMVVAWFSRTTRGYCAINKISQWCVRWRWPPKADVAGWVNCEAVDTAPAHGTSRVIGTDSRPRPFVPTINVPQQSYWSTSSQWMSFTIAHGNAPSSYYLIMRVQWRGEIWWWVRLKRMSFGQAFCWEELVINRLFIRDKREKDCHFVSQLLMTWAWVKCN